MKVRSLVNTRDTLHQNLWGLSPSLYMLKINFRFNFSRSYLRYTVLIVKGEVSFSERKKKKDDASCGTGMRNLGLGSTCCTPGIMVDFERTQDSWYVVPFPSSLYLEEFLFSEYIPILLLILLSKTKSCELPIFNMLLIHSRNSYLLYSSTSRYSARYWNK